MSKEDNQKRALWREREMTSSKGGTSLPEQIIYNWLKEGFGEENVVNRDKSHNGIEFDIFVKNIDLLIEYGDALYHDYKNDTKGTDIVKVNYAINNNIKLLRVFNDGETDEAYLDEDLIVFNGKKDKYLLRQVLVFVSYYIQKHFGVYIEPNAMDEKVLAKSIANVYSSKYSDSFGRNYKELAQYWDAEKNFGINPNQLSITCPYEYVFKCPKCGKSFKSSIRNFIDYSYCRCCGYNVRFENTEVVNIDMMEGLHENIESFVLDDKEVKCSYADLLFTVLEAAINVGKTKELLQQELIKGIPQINNIREYTIIGTYGFKNQKKDIDYYNMLIEALVILNIDFSDIKVKVKQFMYATVQEKKTNLFNLCKERKEQLSIMCDGHTEKCSEISKKKQITSIVHNEKPSKEESLLEEVDRETVNIIKKLDINTRSAYFSSILPSFAKLSDTEKVDVACKCANNSRESQINLFMMGAGHLSYCAF